MNESLAGVLFETRQGNRYLYDDNTSCVFPCPDVMLDVLQEYETSPGPEVLAALSGKYPNEQIAHNYRFVDRWAKQHGAFFWSQRNGKKQGKPTPAQVENYLLNHGFRQLILSVTEVCNLRCHYCIFSECYPTVRTYTTTSMEFDVARRAVDYYLNMLQQVRQRNPYRRGVITFYGGEPLINFDLIRQVIEYVKETYSIPVYYTMTTNGMLLTPSVADYLVENNVAISVSLDGPKEEHDRLRVTVNGRGTFDKVYENLTSLVERHPDYNAGLVLSCYDCGTDLESVVEFFENEGGRLPISGRATFISPHFTSYFDQYSAADWQRMETQLNRLREKYLVDITNPLRNRRRMDYLDALIGSEARLILTRTTGSEDANRLPFLPYTSTCVPGEKIAVDADGTLHMCEKINQSFPIGHVDDGLDLEAIVNVINRYNEQITSGCTDCPVSKLCGLCFTVVAANGEFKQSANMCQNIRNSVEQRLAYTYSILEANPQAYDGLITDYYEQLVETCTIDF